MPAPGGVSSTAGRTPESGMTGRALVGTHLRTRDTKLLLRQCLLTPQSCPEGSCGYRTFWRPGWGCVSVRTGGFPAFGQEDAFRALGQKPRRRRQLSITTKPRFPPGLGRPVSRCAPQELSLHPLPAQHPSPCGRRKPFGSCRGCVPSAHSLVGKCFPCDPGPPPALAGDSLLSPAALTNVVQAPEGDLKQQAGGAWTRVSQAPHRGPLG